MFFRIGLGVIEICTNKAHATRVKFYATWGLFTIEQFRDRLNFIFVRTHETYAWKRDFASATWA